MIDSELFLFTFASPVSAGTLIILDYPGLSGSGTRFKNNNQSVNFTTMRTTMRTIIITLTDRVISDNITLSGRIISELLRGGVNDKQ
ncbi:MAG: hypothetical protein KAQ69_08095 [Spirochaetales bacterium]|nr:hypothetical protein [Spirochaetales bacterium]